MNESCVTTYSGKTKDPPFFSEIFVLSIFSLFSPKLFEDYNDVFPLIIAHFNASSSRCLFDNKDICQHLKHLCPGRS